MRAVVFKEVGVTPELLDVDLAAPGPDEVKATFAGAGVCGSDLHIQRGEWELLLRRWRTVACFMTELVASRAKAKYYVTTWVSPQLPNTHGFQRAAR